VKILLHAPRDEGDEWRAALVKALPDAAVTVWPDAPAAPDYALVWKPPAELFARVRPAKAIFNLGAGVDALLAVPTLPPGVPVIRLEDAGMATQMVEYVALAVLRAYREADAYAAQQREGRWQPRRRIAKSGFGVGILGFGVLGQSVAAAIAPFGFPLSAWSPQGVLASSRSRGAELPRSWRHMGARPPAAVDARHPGLMAPPRSRPAARRASVNAAASIVVDADLVAALDRGHLESATLDVFGEEPLPSGHPFWHHPRITLTPHVSAVTLVEDSIAQVAGKIRRLERGEAVTGVVDRARGY
jgi:glyoxylate/hydroxypyruvate reductase A